MSNPYEGLVQSTSGPSTEKAQSIGNNLLESIDTKIQNPMPITGSISVDTTGLATDTNQVTGNNLLTSIDNKLTSPISVTGSLTIDPTGLATETKQDTGNASLASIDNKLTSPIDVQITDGAGIANTKQLGTQLTNTDIGLITNTIMHGLSSQGGGTIYDVKVEPSGKLLVSSEVTNFPTTQEIKFQNNFSLDASSRVRTSQITTLADLKTLNQDDSLLLENTGTGTGSFSNNTYTMSVTSGQYLIRRSLQYYQYFSGKSQFIEFTFENFAFQTNVTKRIGYFSSNNSAPYDSNKDGFWIESGNGTYKLIVSNNGVEKLNLDWTLWDNYSLISGYNWNNFSVMAFDYLWLGGAILRVFLKTSSGFVLVHTYNYSGTTTGTFTKSPNQNIRYEIRSSTGSGSLIYNCSQVATEGSVDESGKKLSVNTGSTAIVANTIGTTYPIKAIRKNSTNRDRAVKLNEFQIFVSSNADIGLITVQKNPTLSAALTYSSVNGSGVVEQANGNGTITVTSPGQILYSKYITQNSVSDTGIFEKDFLSFIGNTITDTSDQLVLCITPVTAGVSTFGVMGFKEF